MTIPIQNIYYLLCYAWNNVRAMEATDVSSLPNDRVENLLAKVLSEGVSRLVRRGLDRGYISEERVARQVRGKLLISQSLKRSLFETGRAQCSVDELSYDVAHNQVLKAALTELSRVDTIDGSLRLQLYQHRRLLSAVSDIELRPTAFRRIQLHRNNAHYRFLLNVCELVCKSLLPDEQKGASRFHPFHENPRIMGLLFEAFVGSFLKREQDSYRVSSPTLAWDAEALHGPGYEWLPQMRTDVFLENEDHRMVIETKFYAEAAKGRFESKKIISAHLFQLLAYLEHLPPNGPPATGMLLYAGAGPFPALDYRLGRHFVQVRTLNLDQHWTSIHRDLLALVPQSVSTGNLTGGHQSEN